MLAGCRADRVSPVNSIALQYRQCFGLWRIGDRKCKLQNQCGGYHRHLLTGQSLPVISCHNPTAKVIARAWHFTASLKIKLPNPLGSNCLEIGVMGLRSSSPLSILHHKTFAKLLVPVHQSLTASTTSCCASSPVNHRD